MFDNENVILVIVFFFGWHGCENKIKSYAYCLVCMMFLNVLFL